MHNDADHPTRDAAAAAAIDAALRDVGGYDGLRHIVHDFVTRMVADTMIGFHFDGVDVDQLEQRELQFTAAMLGAPVAYQGRPIRAVHQPRHILGGQFQRRRQLVREAFERHRAPADVVARVLDHIDRLRPMIVAGGDGCEAPGVAPAPLLTTVPGRKRDAEGG